MVGKSKEAKHEKETLLAFLRRTKEGKYAPIEESALPYSRITEETETVESPEEEYYYSIT